MIREKVGLCFAQYMILLPLEEVLGQRLCTIVHAIRMGCVCAEKLQRNEEKPCYFQFCWSIWLIQEEMWPL